MHSEFREGGFRYVNPLLECESSRDAAENIELKPLEERIKRSIDDQRKRKWLTEESVYVSRLNSGKWFSVNPGDIYYPASLTKVPVLITVLKEAEADPHLLGVRIRFSGNTPISNLSQYFAPSKRLDQYVIFLRVLYNASYLSKEMSERALDLLTKIEFRGGLVEGVPADIPVAHKFGGTCRGKHYSGKRVTRLRHNLLSESPLPGMHNDERRFFRIP